MKKGSALSCDAAKLVISADCSPGGLSTRVLPEIQTLCKPQVHQCLRAFTLAEVLLTLAIIGIVAALTIPAVITKATKDQYVTALRKAFNTLKGVEREAIRERGEMKYWAWSNSSNDFGFFKEYFDILKDCGTSTDEGCAAEKYVDIAGNDWGTLNAAGISRIITADGIAFNYVPDNTGADSGARAGAFYVDINGRKSPNKFGRDVFMFYVYKDLGIVPFGVFIYQDTNGDPTDRRQFLSSSEMNRYCKETGATCTAKVLSEGAMNY